MLSCYIIHVKFDVTVFDFKLLSMINFQYYPIQSQSSLIRSYPPFQEQSAAETIPGRRLFRKNSWGGFVLQ